MDTLQVPSDLFTAIRNMRKLDFSNRLDGITEREYFFLVFFIAWPRNKDQSLYMCHP